ncbi:MAG: sulfur carrier protein ThiS [Pseudomonadota bacterium]
MKITVNGATYETGAVTLAALLSELGHDGAVVATAVNGEFAGRASRAETMLRAEDEIEIVAPMQGG